MTNKPNRHEFTVRQRLGWWRKEARYCINPLLWQCDWISAQAAQHIYWLFTLECNMLDKEFEQR